MLKLAGSILVLLCSTGLGMTGAWELKQHYRELRLLKQAVYMLRGEVKYSKATLPEAFGALSGRLPEPFGEFFGSLEAKLGLGIGSCLGSLWEEEVNRVFRKSALKKEEKQRLIQLGESLGYLDLDMQLATMELYLEQLEEDIARSLESLHTKQKLYQSLGMAAGVFLVILLV